jgi:hypothetical protein
MVVALKPSRYERFYVPSVSDAPCLELVTFFVRVLPFPWTLPDGALAGRWQAYRVYHHPLEKNSAAFAAIFAIPQDDSGSMVEGMSVDNPIKIDCVPVAGLEVMLQVLYPM